MIDVKALRIGNWVRHQKDGCVQVKEIPYLIDADAQQEGYLINDQWAGEYEPIELTPELLEKAGFAEHAETAGLYIERGRKVFLMQPDQEDKYAVLLYQSDVGLPFVFLEYIEEFHCLQNIIYDLSHTELEITL